MPQNRNSIRCPYQGKKDKKDYESFSFPCMSQRLMGVSYEKFSIQCQLILFFISMHEPTVHGGFLCRGDTFLGYGNDSFFLAQLNIPNTSEYNKKRQQKTIK